MINLLFLLNMIAQSSLDIHKNVIIFYWVDAVSADRAMDVYDALTPFKKELENAPTKVILYSLKGIKELSFLSFDDALFLIKHYKPSGYYIHESWNRLRKIPPYDEAGMGWVIKKHIIDSFLWDVNIIKDMRKALENYFNRPDILKIFYIGLCPPSQPGIYYFKAFSYHLGGFADKIISQEEEKSLTETHKIPLWESVPSNMIWIFSPIPPYWKAINGYDSIISVETYSFRNFWKSACEELFPILKKDNIIILRK